MIVWTEHARSKLAPRTAIDFPSAPIPKIRRAWKKERFEGETSWIDKTAPADPKVIGKWIRDLAAKGLADDVVLAAREIAGPRIAFEAGLAAQRGWYAEPVGWKGLRALALAFEDRAALMALAEAELAGNMASRLCVAHVFFDRPEWAASIAQKIIGDAKPFDASPLYASLADFDLVAPLLAKRKVAAPLLDLVETFGDRMLDVLLDLYGAKLVDPAEVSEALALFADPRAAARLAKELVKQRARPHALAYFARHPDLAEKVLVPMAEGRSRAALLARETLESAERLHENAGIEEATDLPEALRGPAKKMDPSLRVERLTRPRLANGKALPLSALTRLLDLLKRSQVEAPDPVLVDVLGTLDRRSAAELGWELARHWELRPQKRDRWMIDSLVVLADEEIVRRTTPALKNARLYAILGFIGTDAAAMELVTAIARLGKRSKIAEEPFEALATRRGLTVEGLEDALVTALPGGIDLDYGSRIVHVVFDANLQPNVIAASTGAALKELPDAGVSDDPEKVRDAKRRFADLVEDVIVLSERRIAGLERAMIDGRTGPYAIWKKVWADHPLMVHVARGVIWRCGDRAVRLAEDGSFADEDEAVVSVSGDAPIGVFHPAELGAERVARWSRILADYDQLQPFEQLVRPVAPIGVEEVVIGPPPVQIKGFALWEAMHAIGFAGKQAPLVAKFPHDKPTRGNVPSEIRWSLTADGHVDAVRVGGAKNAPLAEVHPIELSETLRDVERAFVSLTASTTSGSP